MARGDKTQLTTCDLNGRSILIQGDGSGEIRIPVPGGGEARLRFARLADIWTVAADRTALIALLRKAEDAALTADGRAL